MSKSKIKSERVVYAALLLSAIALFVFADSMFVERLNKISTGLLAVLTAGYVLLTYWILKSTRQSIQEQTRPYIVASLPLDGFEVVLSIKNIGNRPANNVKVTFDPSLDVIGGEFSLKGTGQPLLTQSFMPPQFEVRNPVGLTPNIVKLDPAQKLFRVSIKYNDSQGVQYSDEYGIDLNSYVYHRKVVQHDLEHYLKGISESLKNINENLKKSNQRLSD
jgi:Ca2+/Na+ antiporter